MKYVLCRNAFNNCKYIKIFCIDLDMVLFVKSLPHVCGIIIINGLVFIITVDRYM